MYSTHFLYCLITLIVEDLSAYAYFFIEKKVGAERTRIWTVTLAPQNTLENLHLAGKNVKRRPKKDFLLSWPPFLLV